jgi:hypothetical protein
MKNIRIYTVLIIIFFLLVQFTVVPAEEISAEEVPAGEIKELISHGKAVREWSVSDKEYTINYDLGEANIDYQETQLRRFETIFFISLPASFLFSFLGLIVFRGVTGTSEAFSQLEYQYLVFSSIGISMSIALNDNRAVYRRTTTIYRKDL